MNKTISLEEQQELLELIEHEPEEKFSEIISELIESGDRENVSLEEWTNFVSAAISADKPVARVRSFRPLYRYISAAAIVVILGIGAYFYINTLRQPKQIASSNIRPGESKAVLVMENGETIELDKNLKANEVFALNPTIKSITEGELVYNKDAAGASKTSGINILRTPKGGEYRVVLPDGTIAWLNSDSELKFPTSFDDATRKVELKGEAYFEVTSYSNRTWPFIVSTLHQEVQVLGTKFNISAYQEDGFVKTALLEGKVRVLNKNSQETVILKPGQEASLDKASSQLNVYTTEVEEAIAWKEGLFVFNNEDLYLAMNKISRWYDVDVVYKGDFQDKEIWGTVSRNEDINSLFKTLEATGVATFKIEGRRVLVMR
ncbi:FecR family protein [Desertivirga xinjiangensis]|uniref:FecR family protein n=1 Tax=Desertivirga xinjiangensis TaxID=539206 RepID=UPI00210BC6A0|nr:FecR family protein [Pedobacter xinjiangensis]